MSIEGRPAEGAGREATNDFADRFRRFEGKFDLHATSYQIRNPDGAPGGFIPQIEIWDNRSTDTIVHRRWQREPKVYPTKAEADSMALWLGLQWLETENPLGNG